MDLRLQIDGASLLHAFARAPEATRRHLRIGLKESMEEVKEQAQKVHKFTSQTGSAESAVSARFEEPMTGVIYLDPAKPVASMIHQGTRAHAIFPRRKKMLRWATPGGFAFAKGVWHPGTKPDPFLFDALRTKADRVQFILTESVRDAFREAGLA